MATFIGQASDFAPWLQGASINRDRNLRLQYLAGLGLNLNEGYNIYINMISHGPELPEEVFTGSDEYLDVLSQAIKSGQYR
jgi:spermidine synthase